jgi:hypothetical protein
MDSQPVLRIRDVFPGPRIPIFTHPGSRIQKQQGKRGVKKIFCRTFFCSPKVHIIEPFLRIIELFTHKIVTKLSKI